MISLGCAIVEMLMPGKVQLSTCGLTGKQRETAIVKLCETNSKLLPRFVNRAENILSLKLIATEDAAIFYNRIAFAVMWAFTLVERKSLTSLLVIFEGLEELN